MEKLKKILLIGLLFISYSAFAQTTTVWLVRHAEKDTAPGNDPDLSAVGKVRASELAKQLRNQKIAAVFTTPYKRTKQTGEPTLKQFGLPAMHSYETADLAGLAKQILSGYSGREVLVIAHSNTIIPTIKAFGAKYTANTLDDEDYDLLFKLTISPGKITGLEVTHYGAPHHSEKAIPQNKMN